MTKKYGLLYALLIALCIGCAEDVKFVEIEPMKIELRNPGDTKELRVTATNSKGKPIKDAKTFTFSSENSAIADVSPKGVVNATGNGNVAIRAKAPNGVTGEVFVSVCLPKELVCDPNDKLDIRIGSGGPIKCHVLNCKDQIIPKPEISFNVLAKNIAAGDKAVMSFQEGIMSFPLIGSMLGDTEVKVVAYNYEKTIRVHVDEALVIPGEAEYLAKAGGGGGGGKKKGGGDKKKGGGDKKKGGSNDPYSGTKGGFGNMINNMKF